MIHTVNCTVIVVCEECGEKGHIIMRGPEKCLSLEFIFILLNVLHEGRLIFKYSVVKY